MSAFHHTRGRSRRFVILACGILALACSVATVPSLVNWLYEGASSLHRGARDVSELGALVEALGEHPTDDGAIAVVRDRNSRGRLAAIRLLGSAKSGDALAILEGVVADSAESDACRRAALHSISRIAIDRAMTLAERYRNDAVLGDDARTLLASAPKSEAKANS